MSLMQVKKTVAKLNKIRDIIEVSKFSTIQEIARVTKISKNALSISAVARDVFQRVEEKYAIDTGYLKYRKNKKVGKLWVFLSLPKTLLSLGYEAKFKIINKQFDRKKDKLIAIGQIAIDFATKNNYPLEFAAVEHSKKVMNAVAYAIISLYDSKLVNAVSFIGHITSDGESQLDILPVSKLIIKHDIPKDISRSIKKFYPSIINVVENLAQVYVVQTTMAIFYETKYFSLKEQLIRHEESIKSIEENILQKQVSFRKEYRKHQTEELILITQNAARTQARSKQEVNNE